MNSKLFLTAILVALIGILIAINGIGILSKSIFLDNTEKHWQYLKVIKAVDGIGPESFAFDPLGKGPYTGISGGRIIRLDENGSQWTNFAVTSSNSSTQGVVQYQIEGAIGPESLAFDALGEGPYTGVSDGRIIKWHQDQRRWLHFALTSPNRDGCEGAYEYDHAAKEHICGRPLGLCFNKTNGDLYIADAYFGLLKVGPEGGLATAVATQSEGIPFRFCNSLDIDQSTGIVYFTDSSSQFQRRNHISVILSGDKTGRLMKYDPATKQVTVLLGNLSFPNGVALSEDGNYILLAETTSCRILRYWLKTSKAGTIEIVAQLPGFPDNIKRSPRGGFWVGIHSRRKGISKLVLSFPWIGNVLIKLPIDIVKIHSSLVKLSGNGGMAMRISEHGNVLEILEEIGRKMWRSISEVEEKDGNLWIGSVNMPYAGLYNYSS